MLPIVKKNTWCKKKLSHFEELKGPIEKKVVDFCKNVIKWEYFYAT